MAAFAVCAISLAAPAQAGDRANIGHTGFSADGKMFVFEEFGIAAGSGQPYAHLFVVNSDTNEWLVQPIRARGKENAFEGRSFFEERAGVLVLRSKNWTYAERALAGKADFTGAENVPALQSWSGPRLFSEKTGDRKQEVAFGPRVKRNKGDKSDQKLRDHRFEVSMTTRNLLPGKSDAAGCARYAFEVRITDYQTKKARVLLQDKQPPSWRGCITRAEVTGIWAARGRVAVMIAYDTTGFEGPDTRHFVTTGRIP